jgi:uncharacterized protein
MAAPSSQRLQKLVTPAVASPLDGHDVRLYGVTVVGVLEVELRLVAARSLKDKRAVIRPILDTARARYRVAASEVAYQDVHRRAVLEVAAVAAAGHVVTQTLDAVERLIWAAPGAEVVSATRRWVEEA